MKTILFSVASSLSTQAVQMLGAASRLGLVLVTLGASVAGEATPVVASPPVALTAERDSVVAGLYAKTYCTATFVSKLPEDLIRSQDLGQFPQLPIQLGTAGRSVTARSGSVERVAVYRPGLGCTLVPPRYTSLPGDSLSSPKSYSQVAENDARHPAPLRVTSPPPSLQSALRSAFEESPGSRTKNIRALIVLHDGAIVAERYAAKITPDTPLPGYSMAKGVTNLLVGRSVRCGWMRLDDSSLMPQWRLRPDDARAAITVDELLRMTSGLQWTESYDGSASDLMTMLTEVMSASDYAADKSLRLGVKPGEVWSYSGGSYEIASRVLRSALSAHKQRYHPFPYAGLFQRLGMTSALLEVGSDDTYLLSAFMLATARDWARLGQFILDERQGRTSGLLPPHWIEQSVSRSLQAGRIAAPLYGSAFWLNSLGDDVPSDTFYLAGLQGQFLVVVPSRNLVVVQLASAPEDGDWSIRPVLHDILRALPSSGSVAQTAPPEASGGGNRVNSAAPRHIARAAHTEAEACG